MTKKVLGEKVAPIGLLVERAGGKTSDGASGISVLDVRIEGIDQRTAACLGSAFEVDRFNQLVLNLTLGTRRVPVTDP